MTVTDEAPVQLAPAGLGGTPNLNAALAAAQAEMPVIAKGETGKITGVDKYGKPFSYEYSYADLSGLTAVAYPIFGKHGLSFSAQPTLTDAGKFVLRYQLRHESGESLDGVMPLPAAGKAQELGSVLTYYRRYAFCAISGIHPGGDDDDASSANTEQRFDTGSASEAFERATPAPPRDRSQQERQAPAPVTVPPLDAEDPWADKVAAISTPEEGRAAYVEVGELLKAGTIDQERATRLGAVITAKSVSLAPGGAGQPVQNGRPSRIRQEDQGGRKPAAPESTDDDEFVGQFLHRLGEITDADELSAIQAEIGPAITSRTITAETGTALATEVRERRARIAAALAGGEAAAA